MGQGGFKRLCSVSDFDAQILADVFYPQGFDGWDESMDGRMNIRTLKCASNSLLDNFRESKVTNFHQNTRILIMPVQPIVHLLSESSQNS